MKNLNSSLVGILLLSVVFSLVFTSCSKQENVIAESVELSEQTVAKRNFVLPVGSENLSDEELDSYFSNLTPDLADRLETSYFVQEYLTHINKLNLVKRNMDSGSLYADVDLAKYLSEQELSAMSNFQPKVVEARCSYKVGCYYSGGAWCSNSTPYLQVWRRCNGTYYGFCSPNCFIS